MSQPDSSKRSKRTIYRVLSHHGALWRLVTQLIIAARFLSAKEPWGWVFAAHLMLAIQAPARADEPCSGEDDRVARPIAVTLQPNASAFDQNGRFEVTKQLNADLTTEIYVRHSVGSRELFRTITRLQSEIHAVVVGRLPASEGLGFSLEVEEGGSGYRQFCMHGFRFQQDGVVSYRTLAARAETRGGGRFAGDVTDWKSASKPPALVSQTHSFDGTYYHEGLRFGFSVTGDQGIATVSSSSKYKPGDVMLRFTRSSPKAFTGQQLCTDGVFHPVTGTLADEGSIDMAIQGCLPGRYKMVRQGTLTPQSQSTQQQSDKGGAYTDYWVYVAAREAPDITRRFVNEGLSTVTAGLISDTILAIGSRMPEEIARTITLTPHRFLGWTARIISKETTKDILKATLIGSAINGLVIGVIAEAMVDGIREKCPCPALDNYGAIEGLVWILRQSSVAYAAKTAGVHGAITAEAIITGVTLIEASKEGIKLGSDLRDEKESKILAAVMQRVKDFSKDINAETDPQRRAEKLQSLDNYLRHEQTRLPGMAAQFDTWRQGLVANLAQIISMREVPAKQGTKMASPTARDAGQPVGIVSDRTMGLVQNCDRERSLIFTKFNSPTSVEFVNNGPQLVKIYWIDYVGGRVFYNSLASGQSYIQETFVTHPWIFTNASDQCLGVYLPTAQEAKVSIP